MKLTLHARIANEKNPDELPLVIGEFQVDLPENISTAVAKSTRIASLIMNTANKIKQELEHGRS
jgi:hypothetical protein